MTANQSSVNANITSKGNLYYIVISYYQDGKRKQKWIKTGIPTAGNNKRKIEQVRLQMLQEWSEKLSLSPNDMLFSDFLKSWLEDVRPSIEASTYFSYRNTVLSSICPYFEKLGIKLYDLTTNDIQKFYRHKMDADGVSANTIYHYHANIHKCLNYAVKTGRIKKNPSDNVDLPKKQPHIANFYTAEELKKLLEYAKGSPIELIVRLAAWFGLRRGEILGIRWQDVDLASKTLFISGTIKDKGSSGSKIHNMYYKPSAKTSASIRSFPMPDQAVLYLSNLKQLQASWPTLNPDYNHKWDGFVFIRPNGDLIPLEYVSRTFPKLCERAGLRRLKLHELRHTNISLLLEAGASMKELQEWAGHSSYTTTANIYSHIQAKTKERLTEAIEKAVC